MSIGGAIGLVSAVKGFSDSRKASKNASRTAGAQIALSGRQEDRKDEQFKIWKDVYLAEDKRLIAQNKELDPLQLESRRAGYEANTAATNFYKDSILPGQQKLLDEAGPNYDYVTSKAASDSDTAEQRAVDTYGRQLTESGIDASSGAAVMGLSRIARDSAAGRAGNVTGARERERNASFTKLATATGRQPGALANPSATSNSAGIGTGSLGTPGSGLSSAASTYSNLAQGYSQGASAGARQFVNATSDFNMADLFSPNQFAGGTGPAPGSFRAAQTMPAITGGFPGSPPGRAEGGPVEPGETYMVGEEGPEVLVQHPDGGGEVIPMNDPPQVDPKTIERMIRAFLTQGRTGISRGMA